MSTPWSSRTSAGLRSRDSVSDDKATSSPDSGADAPSVELPLQAVLLDTTSPDTEVFRDIELTGQPDRLQSLLPGRVSLDGLPAGIYALAMSVNGVRGPAVAGVVVGEREPRSRRARPRVY